MAGEGALNDVSYRREFSGIAAPCRVPYFPPSTQCQCIFGLGRIKYNKSYTIPQLCSTVDLDGQRHLCVLLRTGMPECWKCFSSRTRSLPTSQIMAAGLSSSMLLENGCAGMIELLLPRDDVDPNKPDDYGQTPLQLATRHGHTAVLALLRPWGPSVWLKIFLLLPSILIFSLPALDSFSGIQS